MTKIPVLITQNYALTADDTQYTLQRRHIVDPTRSPWFKAGMDTEIREEWRPVGYYSLNAGGLHSAVTAAIIRDVNGSTEARTITELLAEYKAETARLSDAILTAFTHETVARAASEEEAV